MMVMKVGVMMGVLKVIIVKVVVVKVVVVSKRE